MTPEEFYLKTYGRAYDIDKSYGYQCWDGMAKFCQDLKIPLSIIHCGITGYVQDIWELRKKSGILTFFNEVAPEDIQTGDWIIWPRNYSMTPKSHVAMAYKGYAYGQSQNGIKSFNLCKLDFRKALGAFRWKGYGKMKIEPGKLITTYLNGNKIMIKGQAEGLKVGLISAKNSAGEVTGKDVQLIANIDDGDHIYYDKLNANYFVMKTGEALGVRAGLNEWSVPRQNAFIYYLINNNVNTSEAGMDTEFWYSEKDRPGVQACSPALITYLHGKKVNMESPATKGSKTVANTQSMLIKTNERWAFAISFGKLTPAQLTDWAVSNIEGLEDLCFMDSGGSSCMQNGNAVTYTTSEKRKISNALAFCKAKAAEPTPSPEPAEETVSKAEYDKIQAELNAVKEELRGVEAEYEKARDELEKANKKLEGVKKIVEE